MINKDYMSELPPTGIESIPSPEQKEFGRQVEIVLKFIRHGERTKEGTLTDHGRDITAERARESGLEEAGFDAVKAIGSNAGPKNPDGMGRSLETADIYGYEIGGDAQFATRAQKALNYQTFVNQEPFDWLAFYNSNLPENFNELSDEEKVNAAKQAQVATVNHLINLDTPEAKGYRQEAAGSFAYVIDHYAQMAKRLKSESKVLIPAGTHGGVMEFVLREALVRKDRDGKEIIGFSDLDEIGGEFSPSEGYDVDIETDEDGNLGPLKVSFDNKSRPTGDFYLDKAKLEELKDFYIKLHSDQKS
jgi:hypothetical protein